MLFDLSAFGLREAILTTVGLVAIYCALLLMRLLRLRRSKTGLAVESSRPLSTDVQDAQPRPVSSELSSAPAGFGEQLAARIGLEADMQQLRAEMAILKREVSELRAARRVSPQYSDAMALARRGFDARGIADECGISIGEAELVLAMSRDQALFQDEVDDGGNARTTEPSGR